MANLKTIHASPKRGQRVRCRKLPNGEGDPIDGVTGCVF